MPLTRIPTDTTTPRIGLLYRKGPSVIVNINRKPDSELARLSTHGAQETVNRKP